MQLPYFEPFYTAHPALLSAGIASRRTEAAKNWYLNHTSRIYGRVLEENGKISIDSFLGGGDCWSIPFLQHSLLGICSIQSVMPKLVETGIGQGFYCNIHLEKFDFSSVCCALDPQTKDVTVYGFDEAGNRFFLFAATANGPQRFSLPRALLLKEAKRCMEKRDGTIEFLWLQQEEHPILPAKIRQDLAEYIGGIPYGGEHPASCKEEFSGVNAVELLCFFSLAADRFAARRALRLQTEHKVCMAKRIFSLERQKRIKEGLSVKYQSCAEEFLRFRREALQGEKISLKEISAYQNKERAVLRQVLDSMDGLHED